MSPEPKWEPLSRVASETELDQMIRLALQARTRAGMKAPDEARERLLDRASQRLRGSAREPPRHSFWHDDWTDRLDRMYVSRRHILLLVFSSWPLV